jgi:hypothetical protein
MAIEVRLDAATDGIPPGVVLWTQFHRELCSSVNDRGHWLGTVRMAALAVGAAWAGSLAWRRV